MMHIFTLGNIILGLAASAAVAAGAVGLAKVRKTRKSSGGRIGDVFDKHRATMDECSVGSKTVFSGRKLADCLAPDLRNENVSNREPNAEQPDLTGPKAEHVSLLGGIDREKLSDGIQRFLKERILEMEGATGDEYGLKRIDLYAELENIMENADGAERDSLSNLRQGILEEVSEAGFEILNDGTWNPELQRAVVVTQGDCEKEIRILKTVAVGLKHNGRLIRKQEVSIITPKA